MIHEGVQKRVGLALLATALLAACAAGGQKPDLWLYYGANLQVDENVDRLEVIWRRAAAAGYSHVMLTDSKSARLGELGDMETRYRANVARVKKIAAEFHLQIVPVLFSIGWSNNMLWHNPNLAEGLPVRDAPFVVRKGEAVPAGDPPVAFGARPDWADDNVKIEGGVATAENIKVHSRFVYQFKLPAFRNYHVSVWIKTADFDGTPEIKALAGDRMLQYQNLGVKRTQDWTRHHVVFNTLDNERVGVYFGVWGDARGRLQWKDWKIEEAGLVNVLRRPGAPVVVKGESDTVYVEGRDYEKIEDPKVGNTPWPGEYEAWHTPPVIRTRLRDGTRLRVSWYHPAIIYDGAVVICLSEPETLELLKDEAARVRALWDAKGYMMAHDEIRTMNWDAACQARKLDAGSLLAGNVRMCQKLLAGAQVYVWSDMFDPHHNARKDYYLARGDLRGSWEGLDKSVIIVNWNFGQRDKSLDYFADRGHKQIMAGYYDGPATPDKEWLAAARKVKGVVGIMYTTWQNRYEDLEAFAKACRAP